MTLTAKVLPLSQLDTTLIDVRLYVNLLAQAAKIKSPGTRQRVEYVIGVAYENANDTVIAEGACAPDEWARIFKGTAAGFSVDALRSGGSTPKDLTRANRLALAWFHKRGIVG